MICLKTWTLYWLSKMHDESLKRHAESWKRHAESWKRHAESWKRHAESWKRHAESWKRHAESWKRHAESWKRHTESWKRHAESLRMSHWRLVIVEDWPRMPRMMVDRATRSSLCLYGPQVTSTSFWYELHLPTKMPTRWPSYCCHSLKMARWTWMYVWFSRLC